MIKRIKRANALMFTVVILLAVSIIASGITMYFYHASLQANNSNIYSQKRVELENDFNQKYLIIIDDSRDDSQYYLRKFFAVQSGSKSFLDGERYTTIKYESEKETAENYVYTYKIETVYKRRECQLIKTIYKNKSTNKFSVDTQEVYHVTITN